MANNLFMLVETDSKTPERNSKGRYVGTASHRMLKRPSQPVVYTEITSWSNLSNSGKDDNPVGSSWMYTYTDRPIILVYEDDLPVWHCPHRHGKWYAPLYDLDESWENKTLEEYLEYLIKTYTPDILDMISRRVVDGTFFAMHQNAIIQPLYAMLSKRNLLKEDTWRPSADLLYRYRIDNLHFKSVMDPAQREMYLIHRSMPERV